MFFLFLLYKTSKTAILPLIGPTRVQQCYRNLIALGRPGKGIKNEDSQISQVSPRQVRESMGPPTRGFLLFASFLSDWASDC